VTLDPEGRFIWGENVKGFGRPIRTQDLTALVLAPAVFDLVGDASQTTRCISSEEQSWIVSVRTFEDIAVFQDLEDPRYPRDPSGTPRGPSGTPRGPTGDPSDAECCDVTLLLHGGNRIGNGWIVYSRDERWILPVFEYLHTVLVFLETGRSLLHRFTTLRSLVFLEFFLANIFKTEYCVSRTHLHPFHRLVLQKMFTLVPTSSYVGHVTLSKVTTHL